MIGETEELSLIGPTVRDQDWKAQCYELGDDTGLIVIFVVVIYMAMLKQ